jgi:hypothetical protein
MKRLFSITLAMLLSSAMFFVAVSAGGDSVTKPFNAKWTGIIYVTGFCTDTTFPPGAVQAINVGKGVTTLTGESDWISGYCFYQDTATSMVGSGWGIITTPKGDTMHASVSVSADLSKNPVEWRETEYTLGGTGRFVGATGTSESYGTWTSGTNLFPYGAGIPPNLAQPQGWVGTTEGEVEFTK